MTGFENSTEWYEAYDPPSNLQGMVPVSYFEVVSRKDSIPTIPLHTAAAAAAAHGGVLPAKNSNLTSSPETFVNQETNNLTSSTNSTMHSTNTAINSSQSISPVSTNSNSNFIKGGMNNHSQLYAVVKHDFVPSRSDELQASVGESIIIIARSNDEWVVAKPIGRLGGPGLIPINFIEVRDIGTNKPMADLNEALNRAHVPYVEEWKRLAAEYKASSIPLGKIDDLAVGPNNGRSTPSVTQQLKSMHLNTNTTTAATTSNTNVLQKSTSNSDRRLEVSPLSEKANSITEHTDISNSNISVSSITATSDLENESYVVSASVDTYAFNNDRYWYLVVAKLSNGKQRNLCRFYQDFYDFQINLLDEFPVEAGRTGHKRTLPFMPGPLTYVNDSISSQRRVNLDDYVKKLVALPNYISKGPTVQHLFDLREGDMETDGPTPELPSPMPSQENIAVNEVPKNMEEQQHQILQEEDGARTQASSNEKTAENQHQQSQLLPAAETASFKSELNDPAPELEPEVLPPVVERAVKVKIFYEDDLIAVRVPNTISLLDLSAKITDRLELASVVLLYKDDISGNLSELHTDADLRRAFGNKLKLILNAK